MLLPSAIALAAVLFYVATAAPGLAHADQAIVIDGMCAATLSSAATHHNLTALAGYWPCRLGAVDGIAYRCNLLSAVLGGLAIGLFFGTARRFAGPLPGLIASLFLLVSHSMWWHATVAEVYAANALLCAGVLYGLVRHDQSRDQRWLWAAAASAGLGVFNHLQMGFWLPGLAAGSWLEGGEIRERLRRLLRLALAYGAGILPYALVYARDTLQRGGFIAAREASGGEFSRIFFTASSTEVLATVRLFMLQWGWPSLFLIWVAWGVSRLLRSPEWRCTRTTILVGFLVNTAFFALYPTWDKFAFLLPSFVIASLSGAAGLAGAWAVARRHAAGRVAFLAANLAALAWAPVFFARLPGIAVDSKLWSSYRLHYALRLTVGDGRYLANPDKSDYTIVERYISSLEERLPPQATLVDHVAATFFQFAHAQTLRGWRSDVTLRLFVPSFSDPRRWPRGFGSPDGASVILEARRSGPVYSTSLLLGGFSEVVEDLLSQGWTFVEQPVLPGISVWELARGEDAAQHPLVANVVAAAAAASPGVTVTFTRRNPPLRLGVTWRTPNGQRLGAPGSFDIPFDSPPVFAAAPPGAATAELDVFGVAAGAVRLASASPGEGFPDRRSDDRGAAAPRSVKR
jgi:hypothetical protein